MIEIEVISIGSTVVIGEEIKGTVVGVCIRAKNYINYEIAWWNDNVRHLAWVEQVEIHEDQNFKEMKVGFVRLGG